MLRGRRHPSLLRNSWAKQKTPKEGQLAVTGREESESKAENPILDFIVERYASWTKALIIDSILIAIWFPVIVKYAGAYILLVNPKDNSLTILGWIITAVIYSVYTLKVIVESVRASHSTRADELQGRIAILSSIIKSLFTLSKERYSKVLEAARTPCADPFMINEDQMANLKSISQQIENCIIETTHVQHKFLIVSMAYRLPNKEWEYIDQSMLTCNTKLSELISNPSSTMYNVLNGDSDYLFYNDKQEAISSNKYVEDTRDCRNAKKGSIACLCIRVPVVDDEAVLILSVASYGQKFSTADNANNAKITIGDVVLEQFIPRIKYELAMMTIKSNRDLLCKPLRDSRLASLM